MHNQQRQILNLLKAQGTVTTYDIYKLGICQYNARIHDLRHKGGHNITCKKVVEDGRQYGIYKLEK